MLDAHMDFFEEICKYRAMRRMWAKLLRQRFGSQSPRSWQLRFHTQTSGAALTAQQPLNNVARSTIQALAAVLGGTQSLHVSCYDECYSVPSQTAAELSLNIQNIIAFESGVTNTIDPLGGSYFVEALTNRLEEEAGAILRTIGERGGMVEASLSGWVQAEKARYVRQYQEDIEKKRRVIVGVNEFQGEGELPIEVFRVPPEFEQEKAARLRELRRRRENQAVERALDGLARACERGENTILPTLEAVKTYATLGEIYATMRKVYGEVTPEEMHSACVKV